MCGEFDFQMRVRSDTRDSESGEQAMKFPGRTVVTLIVFLVSWVTETTRAADFKVPAGQRQLFLDDHGIAKIENLKRRMHRPEKQGAVIRPRYLTTSERSIQTRSGPQWDAERGVYRIWLLSKDCYESRDGLHWVPTATQPTESVQGAVIDPGDTDASRRYKGLVATGGKRLVVVSPDGLAWRRLDVPAIPSQDESNLSFDSQSRTFIATVKHRGPFGRSVWLSTSKDFQKWTKPELIFHADAKDQELARKVIERRVADKTFQPMRFVDPEVYNVQVYNMGVFRYEGLYVGLPAMFHSTGKVDNYPNTDGFHLVQLACSRDLKTWRRLGDREPFIGPSRLGSGAFDLTQILPPSAPIVRGDELWFYYTGLKYRATFNYEGKYPNGKIVVLPQFDGPSGAICLAVLRRDGFVSLQAGATTGVMTTEAFVSQGEEWHVNAQLAEGGRLVVEVIDDTGAVVAISKPVTGDHPRWPIRWARGSGRGLVNQRVRARFHLTQGHLFSYWMDRAVGKPKRP